MTRGKVFLVDDDPSVRRALERLIRSAGYDVQPLADAESYLALSVPGEPACLVLDMRMSGLGGLDLQAELDRRGVKLPIIFVSVHGDVSTTVRAMKAGAVDFLTKPVDGELLLARVHAALARIPHSCVDRSCAAH